MLQLIILNCLYAAMFIFAKQGLAVAQPIFMTGIRMMMGGFMSLIIYTWLHHSLVKKITSINLIQWLWIGMLTLCNVYICNSLEIWALQYLSVGKTAFIYNLTPFFSALFSYFLFSEIMTMQKWAGLILGFIGFLPILLGPSQIVDITTRYGYFSLAEIALFGAAVTSIIGWTIMRLLLETGQFSPFFLNGVSMLLGGLLCLVHAAWYEHAPYITQGAMVPFVQLVILLGLFKQTIAYNLNSFLLTRYTTTLVAFFSFSASLIAACLGVIFLDETISIYFVISVITVFIGLALFYQEELRQGYMRK